MTFIETLKLQVWRMSKVREEWELEPPYQFCRNCGDEPLLPAAYNDSGEWYLHWYCDVCGDTPDDSEHMIQWPMRRNYATNDDLKRLGFYLV